MSGPFLNFIRQGISQASFDLEKANQDVYSQCPEFQNNTERTLHLTNQVLRTQRSHKYLKESLEYRRNGMLIDQWKKVDSSIVFRFCCFI